VCLLLVVGLIGCAGCQDAPQRFSPGSALTRIEKAGMLDVCSTGDYRPFTYRDGGDHWSGLDIDLARDLAHRLGVTLDLVPTTWASVMGDLGGKCDLAMGGITLTLDRARQALFSAPYLRDGKAALIRCPDRARYTSLADIDQLTVRVITPPSGTNAEFDRTHLKRAQLIEFADNNTIFGQLTSGAADVMITDVSEIRWETTQEPSLCGVGVDHPFTFEQKAYLVAQGEFGLQQWVDAWLNIVRNDGTFAALSQKYLGGPTGP
jgi:cyclohexadienyl dehydratase